MTTEDLARDVLHLLDKQKEYFKTKEHDLLVECKTLEQALRHTCNEIIKPTPKKPNLFDQIEGAT